MGDVWCRLLVVALAILAVWTAVVTLTLWLLDRLVE